MPIAQVLLTDTFNQWFTKTNQMIDKVNTLGATGEIVSIANPLVGQIMVYDGNTFRNVPMSGDVTINANGQTSVVSGGGGTSKGKIFFAASMRGIY